MSEPDWLTWTREMQAIAQTGLAYATSVYDRERYEQLRTLASRIMATHTDAPADRIADLFAGQHGYATPKIDVRAAVFDEAGRILMVRERLDHDRWTLPGGWAETDISAAANAVKEVREESGYGARVRKLAAAWDRTTQGHPADPFAALKMFFLCDLDGGEARISIETSEVGWFPRDAIPDDLSRGRVLPGQIACMFAHHDNPGRPTDFD
jgi:ADP-ribose pyrophosphatase YjhB (NUDIX family)